MMNHQRMDTIRQIWLYLFSVFLLMEWIRPVSEFTDTGYTYGFLLFIVCSLILHFFSVHWLFRFLLLILLYDNFYPIRIILMYHFGLLPGSMIMFPS